jgi:hypothetical protein
MAVCLSVVAGCAPGYTEYVSTTASTVSIVFISLFGSRVDRLHRGITQAKIEPKREMKTMLTVDAVVLTYSV